MSSKIRHTILVFGNALLKQDSLPLRLLPKLKERFPDIEFKEFDPNENLEKEGRRLNIIDTVAGIREVMLITDVDSIKPSPMFSMHDFDLGYSLKMLRKLNYIDGVKIFGVPMKISSTAALKQLSDLISANLS